MLNVNSWAVLLQILECMAVLEPFSKLYKEYQWNTVCGLFFIAPCVFLKNHEWKAALFVSLEV